jgi:hypothetical protein
VSEGLTDVTVLTGCEIPRNSWAKDEKKRQIQISARAHLDREAEAQMLRAPAA